MTKQHIVKLTVVGPFFLFATGMEVWEWCVGKEGMGNCGGCADALITVSYSVVNTAARMKSKNIFKGVLKIASHGISLTSSGYPKCFLNSGTVRQCCRRSDRVESSQAKAPNFSSSRWLKSCCLNMAKSTRPRLPC